MLGWYMKPMDGLL